MTSTCVHRPSPSYLRYTDLMVKRRLSGLTESEALEMQAMNEILDQAIQQELTEQEVDSFAKSQVSDLAHDQQTEAHAYKTRDSFHD